MNEVSTTQERKRRLQADIDRAKDQIFDLNEDIHEWENQIRALDVDLIREFVYSKGVGSTLRFTPTVTDIHSPTYVAIARPNGWLVMNSTGSPKELTTSEMVPLLIDKKIVELTGKDVEL